MSPRRRGTARSILRDRIAVVAARRSLGPAGRRNVDVALAAEIGGLPAVQRAQSNCARHSLNRAVAGESKVQCNERPAHHLAGPGTVPRGRRIPQLSAIPTNTAFRSRGWSVSLEVRVKVVEEALPERVVWPPPGRGDAGSGLRPDRKIRFVDHPAGCFAETPSGRHGNRVIADNALRKPSPQALPCHRRPPAIPRNPWRSRRTISRSATADRTLSLGFDPQLRATFQNRNRRVPRAPQQRLR